MDITSYLLGKKAGGGGGSSDLDWSAIGYSDTPQSVIDAYNYAKQIYDNWDSSETNLSNKFSSDKNLIIMPLVDTSNATNMSNMVNSTNLIEFPLLDTSYVTNMGDMFRSCRALKAIPLLDTKNVENMGSMFYQCESLTTIPLLDTSSVTNMNSMFNNSSRLSDTSLDNILQMCINATSYTGTKTLVRLGISSSYYSVSRIEALTHYQDFIDAGWTIGY